MVRIAWIGAVALLFVSCGAYDENPPDTDADIVCRPPQMILVNHEESQHPVKKVYLHDYFYSYKDSWVVAEDIALGERTEPFDLCSTPGCTARYFITYTREKILGSVETVAVTTEAQQTFTCERRYTVYLLGEDFLITHKAIPADPVDDEYPDDDSVL